jgi:hypothetical protein
MVYFLLPPKIENENEWRALKKAPSLIRLRIKSTQTDANASFSFTLRVHASKRCSQIEFRLHARTKKNSFLFRETATTTEKKEGEICAQRKMSKSKHIITDAISYLHHGHVQNGLHAGNASNRRFRHRLLVRVLLGGGVTDSCVLYAREIFFFFYDETFFSPFRGLSLIDHHPANETTFPKREEGTKEPAFSLSLRALV